MNHRVENAKAKLKKGDLVVVEWVDIVSEQVDWAEVEGVDSAQIRSCGWVHAYDGKHLILSRDLDAIGGDATPTVLPMGSFLNVVLSCQRILKRGREEVWDIGKQDSEQPGLA